MSLFALVLRGVYGPMLSNPWDTPLLSMADFITYARTKYTVYRVAKTNTIYAYHLDPFPSKYRYAYNDQKTSNKTMYMIFPPVNSLGISDGDTAMIGIHRKNPARHGTSYNNECDIFFTIPLFRESSLRTNF